MSTTNYPTTLHPVPPTLPWYRRPLALWVGLLLLFVVAQFVPQLHSFPETWNLGLRAPLNEFKRWVVVNRTTHWLFLYGFEPLSAVIDFVLRRAENLLLWLPWPVIVLGFFTLAQRIGGLRLALLTTGCLLLMGLLGLWQASMQTLALMVIAVLIALAIGIPLGIWTARNDRGEALLRPVLDAMQTMPAFVYLIPVLLFFGVARVPSVIATVIYALPPAIRLTNLGIRSVPEDALEAAHAFGSTERQLLYKVQIPLAMPSILAGVNQTIMMALSIVVIAALIGAGGLGDVVLKALRRLQVGAALEAGLAIVVMAILLDRLSAALTRIRRQQRPRFQGFRLFPEQWRGIRLIEGSEAAIDGCYQTLGHGAAALAGRIAPWAGRRREWVRRHAPAVSTGLLLLLLMIMLPLVGVQNFPSSWNLGLRNPVDALVQWMQVNLYDIGGSGIGTGSLRDFLIIYVFKPSAQFLTSWLPWPVILVLGAMAAWRAGGWRLMVAVGGLTLLIGLLGMWPFAMDTLSQTLIAVVLCIALGIPLGIGAAHNDQVDQFLRPVLDFLQTIPIFVYLVPVIMLFGTGSVAGLIASVLYAVAPVARLTSLGIRQVDPTILESAEAFGSTGLQKLRKVEIPLAMPTIMLGINQTILMVLAMVIIAGLVGATGLGMEVVQGFANDNLGRSVEAGMAIVLLAIIIDRITQAWAHRTAQAANLTESN
ncbi:MAG: ABC transporter permease subunit [Caldilineaceae bacterium]